MDEKKELDEKKEPLPFRYIDNDDFNKQEETEGETMSCSVMYKDDLSKQNTLAKSFETKLGVGDMDTIEQVLRRHEEQRQHIKLIKK